jgi:D-glycero-alpha-D-manno-heptose-7-phosphate kinase
MIISKTPYRISFFGGGTDYPVWYRKYGGSVLSTSIDKYCYISCRVVPRFFSHKYRIVWSHIENVDNISEILHPAVREGLRYLGINGDMCLEIHHQGDLPARAGMGSSSSFTVGLIKAILALKGIIVSDHELALKAIEFEQNWLKEKVGSQDQMAAAHGGFNIFHFQKCGTIQVDPMTISKERVSELENHLLMFYTGSSRLSSEISADIIQHIDQKEKVLKRMHGMVDDAIQILNSDNDICEFGSLLNQSWQLKRQLSTRISSETIDKIYNIAMSNGAVGGKLLGAGASGFMVFFAAPEYHEKIKAALPGYLHIPFKFETQGSTIIHYSSEN